MAHCRGRSVGGIPTPNRGCGRHDGTFPHLKPTPSLAVADDTLTGLSNVPRPH